MITIIAVIVAVVSALLSIRFYVELRRWSNICKNGRIAIAYKRKVQLQAPLTEWYLWTRKLSDTENGRVVYRNGGVTVAIVKPVVPPGPIRRRLKRGKDKPRAQARHGSWSINKDKSAS